MEYFFIGNCNFFHRVSNKYGLNNKILNFKKILCGIFLSRTSLMKLLEVSGGFAEL